MAEKKQAAKPGKKVVKKGKTVDKWKKKQWYSLVAPAEFDRTLLGETVAEKPKNLLGRTIISDLGQLTGQRQKRYVKVIFQVEKVEGNNANCKTAGHEIGFSFLNRLLRRRTSKVELVQTVETEDNAKVKVKTVALSVRKLTRKQERSIRKFMLDFIEKAAKKKPFQEFSQELIFGALASKLFKQVSKIAPLKRVEVTKSRLMEGK
jgi:small subunit ribosomal protein S3Ae